VDEAQAQKLALEFAKRTLGNKEFVDRDGQVVDLKKDIQPLLYSMES
jgi:hypothetical protein